MKDGQKSHVCESCKSNIEYGVNLFNISNKPTVCPSCKAEYSLNPVNYLVMSVFLFVILIGGVFISSIREYVHSNKGSEQIILGVFIAAVVIATNVIKSQKLLVSRKGNESIQDMAHSITVAALYATLIIVPISIILSIIKHG